MPMLTKKTQAKTGKSTSNFKSPFPAKENIENILKAQDETNSKRKKHTTDVILNPYENKKSSKTSISLSVSFEDIPIPSPTEISNKMNVPHIKEAYLQFISKPNHTTPLFGESGGESDAHNILDQSSSSLDRSISRLEQSASLFDQSTDDIFTESHDDSGLGFHLSQEVLNSQGIKEKYLEFCKETSGGMKKDLETLSNEFKSSGTKRQENPKKQGNKQKRNKDPKKENEPKKTVLQKKRPTKKISNADSNVLKKASAKKTKKLESKDESLENLGILEKIKLIHESRNVGLYVYCDSCDKARYLPDVKDPLELPEKWYCSMNPDLEKNNCSAPEEIEEEEDFLIHNLYNAGSIVWAKIDGYPWWPAMVEDDPVAEQYFWLEDTMTPTWYHVTFFDSCEVTRSWMRPSELKPFKINIKNPESKLKKFDKYEPRLNVAFQQASEAIKLPLLDRLKKFSFIFRYKNISKLKKMIKEGQKDPIEEGESKKHVARTKVEKKKLPIAGEKRKLPEEGNKKKVPKEGEKNKLSKERKTKKLTEEGETNILTKEGYEKEMVQKNENRKKFRRVIRLETSGNSEMSLENELIEGLLQKNLDMHKDIEDSIDLNYFD